MQSENMEGSIELADAQRELSRSTEQGPSSREPVVVAKELWERETTEDVESEGTQLGSSSKSSYFTQILHTLWWLQIWYTA